MTKIISEEVKSSLVKLGIYQVIGGAIGTLLILWSVFTGSSLTGLTLLVYVFMLLFFGYSIFCGVLCLKAKQNALRHSIINQLMQVFGFAVLGFAFKYIAGLYLTVGLDLTESFEISFGAGISKFDFLFNKEADRIEIDFNLVAIILVYCISKLFKKVKAEYETSQVSSIGQN
jgi:hypothetical protein